jgi:hypothetical protein
MGALPKEAGGTTMKIFIYLYVAILVLNTPNTVGSSSLVMLDQVDCTIVGTSEGATVKVFPKLSAPAKLYVAPVAVMPKEHPKYASIRNFLERFTDSRDAHKTTLLVLKKKDPDLWASIAAAESGCNSTAISPAGAQGKWQVMPQCKLDEGFEFYRDKHAYLDDSKNLEAANKIMDSKLKDTRGNKWLAVERYCGQGPDARDFAVKVRRYYAQIKSNRHS